MHNRRIGRTFMLDFADEFPYGDVYGGEAGIYTDNIVLFGEMERHAIVNKDGKTTCNMADGFNTLLPQKAEELGFKQAYIDVYLGMRALGYENSDCMDLMGIGESECSELATIKVLKYRIFPGGMALAKEIAAEHFELGYNKAYEQFASKNTNFDIDSIRIMAGTIIKNKLRDIFKEELVREYLEIYGGAI